MIDRNKELHLLRALEELEQAHRLLYSASADIDHGTSGEIKPGHNVAAVQHGIADIALATRTWLKENGGG